MLTITADVFSGRPDPMWVVDDDAEARAALAAIARERELVATASPADGGLGFRGLSIELSDDDVSHRLGLPARFYVPVAPASGGARSGALVEQMLALLKRGTLLDPERHVGERFDEGIQRYLVEQLQQSMSGTVRDGQDAPLASARVEAHLEAITCFIELWAFNPGFWNDDTTTRQNNNCYNYASNWRTNTFAQPGKGAGHQYTSIACGAVGNAAMSDGMHHRYTCFPDSEKPRFLVALVVAPGPGFVDYHWYRKHQGNFWGHKPGGTNARNVDESHVVITDPSTCNRGPYTNFCGYFYGCNSQRRRIR